jgi:two-component system sensor histidine kinase DegS
MSLSIYDDGKGFDSETLNGNARHGFGLLGMTERVNLLGGELKIESEFGKGTTINIFLPCEGNRNGN